MRSFLFIVLASLLAIAQAVCADSSGEAGSTPESERGAVPGIKRTWHSAVDGGGALIRSTGKFVGSGVSAVAGLFKFGGASGPAKESKQRLHLDLVCSSKSVLLSSNPTIEVQLRIVNPTKRAQLLKFSSGRRVDVVLRDPSGRIVARASEGGADSAQESVVAVNPGERLEYRLVLPTDGMSSGGVYSLEAAVTGQAGLLAREEIAAK